MASRKWRGRVLRAILPGKGNVMAYLVRAIGFMRWEDGSESIFDILEYDIQNPQHYTSPEAMACLESHPGWSRTVIEYPHIKPGLAA